MKGRRMPPLSPHWDATGMKGHAKMQENRDDTTHGCKQTAPSCHSDDRKPMDLQVLRPYMVVGVKGVTSLPGHRARTMISIYLCTLLHITSIIYDFYVFKHDVHIKSVSNNLLYTYEINYT